MLKQATKSYRGKFDCRDAKYVNISNTEYFLFKDNSVRSVKYLRSDFYYSIFLNSKIHKPIYEKKWENIFKISGNCIWKNIYTAKIKHMYENKISEFNYKLLHCIICNNLSVSKWNKEVTPLCEFCHIVEDNEHLLFSCKITKNIWGKIQTLLKFDITWKTIVLGFYHELNTKTSRLNNIISFISYTIYKYKMKCKFNKVNMSEDNLRTKLKHCLSLQNSVLKKANKIVDNSYIDISNNL